MAARPPLKLLLVEGKEDLRLIPEFIEANGIRWGERGDAKLVDIKDYDGVENLLAPDEIETRLKTSGLRALGILLDADDDPRARWQQVRSRCLRPFPAIPQEIPGEGLIIENSNGIRLGVWLMPDNRSRGMMETFLALLRSTDPRATDVLWQHTCNAYDRAVELGAPCREAHADKARIHTWLAWRDPPGRQLHQAVKERILDARSPQSILLLRWFCTLYEVAMPADRDVRPGL